MKFKLSKINLRVGIRATADHDVNIPFRLYADW